MSKNQERWVIAIIIVIQIITYVFLGVGVDDTMVRR